MIEVIHFLLFGLVAALHPHCIVLSPLIGVVCFLMMESQPGYRCSCCVRCILVASHTDRRFERTGRLTVLAKRGIE